jgi:NADPH:quinone reductase-like Zn-dependent oxidoreductase
VSRVRAAGIRKIGDTVELIDLPEPRALRADEVLLDVQACGVGNWDEFVRTGGWDTGARPPMAMGVEAAGLVAATGNPAGALRPGDRVTTHSLPLREQGGWAEKFIAAAGHVAPVPPGVSMDAAAALPVPALTADQALSAVDLRAGQALLVNGGSGVTGSLLVQLAVYQGARVIATAGPDSADRLLAAGAVAVLDYHQPDWPQQARSVAGGGTDAAVNAVPSGARAALRAVRDGGRLATITSDAPPAERGITAVEILVAPDGARLSRLTRLLAQGVVTVTVGARYPLEQAAAALALARRGAHGAAVVLRPGMMARADPGPR